MSKETFFREEAFMEEYDRIISECEEEDLSPDDAHDKALAGACQFLVDLHDALARRLEDEAKQKAD
jgi:hypothetical protein